MNGPSQLQAEPGWEIALKGAQVRAALDQPLPPMALPFSATVVVEMVQARTCGGGNAS